MEKRKIPLSFEPVFKLGGETYRFEAAKLGLHRTADLWIEVFDSESRLVAARRVGHFQMRGTWKSFVELAAEAVVRKQNRNAIEVNCLNHLPQVVWKERDETGNLKELSSEFFR